MPLQEVLVERVDAGPDAGVLCMQMIAGSEHSLKSLQVSGEALRGVCKNSLPPTSECTFGRYSYNESMLVPMPASCKEEMVERNAIGGFQLFFRMPWGRSESTRQHPSWDALGDDAGADAASCSDLRKRTTAVLIGSTFHLPRNLQFAVVHFMQLHLATHKHVRLQRTLVEELMRMLASCVRRAK